MTRPSLPPYPSPFFGKQVEFAISQSFGLAVSGELTTGRDCAPIGSPKTSGRVANVYLSVERSGKDDSHALQVSGEVYINSTSCLSTQPSISHVSGEASQQKTTIVAGDTGIAQAVIDQDNNSYNAGDVITADLILERTATPTTEIRSPILVVELDPD